MTFYTNLTVDLPSGEIDIRLKIEYSTGNSGLGHYEYWGQKCFDKGVDYIEFECVTFDKKNLTADEISTIFQAVEDNKLELEQQIARDLEDRKNYAAEERAERNREFARENLD